MRTASTHTCIPILAVALLVALPLPGFTGSLFGVTGTGAGEELHLIEPGTGTSVLLVAHGFRASVAPATAVNRSNGRLYQIGVRDAALSVLRLVTIDPQSRTIVSEVDVDRSFANLQVRDDGVLIGLSWSGSSEELRTIDPATGVSALLGTVPGLARLIPSANALNGTDQRLYQIGFSTGRPSVPQLYVLNSENGSFVDSLDVDATYLSLHVRSDRRLVGLSWNGTQEELRLIDASTGASTLVKTIAGLGLVPPASSAIDVAAGRVYQIGLAAVSSDPPRIFCVEATGGAFFSDVAADAGYSTLRHSPLGSPVAVQVALYESRWVGDRVEVTWALMGDEFPTGIEVLRRVGPTGEYRLVPDAHVVLESGQYLFTDRDVARGEVYGYRIALLNGSMVAAWFETSVQTPTLAFGLFPGEPNPFGERTRIRYQLASGANVTLRIFDLSGRVVRTLVAGFRPAGAHDVEWDGRDEHGQRMQKGVYFGTLRSGLREQTRKLFLLN